MMNKFHGYKENDILGIIGYQTVLIHRLNDDLAQARSIIDELGRVIATHEKTLDSLKEEKNGRLESPITE